LGCTVQFLSGPWTLAKAKITMGGKYIITTAAIVQGQQIGWEGVWALKCDLQEDVQRFVRLNEVRRKMDGNGNEYIPITINDDGKVIGAKIDTESVKTLVQKIPEATKSPEVVTEAPPEVTSLLELTESPIHDDNNAEEYVVGENGDGVVGSVLLPSVDGVGEGVLVDGAGTGPLTDTTKGIANTTREDLVKLTHEDDTLGRLRDLAN